MIIPNKFYIHTFKFWTFIILCTLLNSCTFGSKKHKSIPEVYINASEKLSQFPVEDGNVIKYVTKHLHYP